MSASGVRAGKVFVEIGADPKAFFSAFSRVNRAIGNLGKSLVSGGTRLAAAGAGMAAPIVAAVRSGSRFESTLLNIKASTGATAAELDRIKAASMQMSSALGVGPTEAAQGMLELLKAGAKLETVLGGAGQSAIEFAKVGEMDVAQAAVVMSDAMNVFGVSGSKAANTLSAAADASSTSIVQMSEAFSMSSAVAGLANQSIDDLSAALAILANAGVKGSDAGTSVKTMLMRLMAPAEDGAAALAQLGLSTQSFRGADGKMRPMVEILGVLNQAMGGLDQAAKDDVFRRIFGADAIRAASILSSAGVDGFNSMLQSMSQAMSVSDKFKSIMGGLAGAGIRLLGALERIAIAVSDAVSPALQAAVPLVEGLMNGFAKFLTENKAAVVLFAQVAAGAIALGVAMIGVGYALQAVSGSIGLVLRGFGIFSALASPVMVVAAAVGAVGYAAYRSRDALAGVFGFLAPAVADATTVLSDLATTATETFSGVYEAITAGDLAGAMDILWAGLIAGWLRGTEAIMSYVDPWIAAFQDAFTIFGAEIYKTWDTLWVTVGNAINTAGAYMMGAFDNIINPILAAWDVLEAGIRKAWIRISGIFKDGEDKQKELDSVDAEMTARADRRAAERPGVNARVDQAAKENEKSNRELADRKKAIDEATQATANEREAANQQRAQQRRDATQAAEANVGATTAARRGKRVMDDQYSTLLKEIESATSLDQLHDLHGQFQALNDNGRLTSGQADILENAITDAQERVSRAGASMTGSPAQAAATAGAQSAGEQSRTSMGSVAGTFSSLNLGAAFGGQSAADRTAKACEEIARNTRDMNGDRVAA